MKPPEFGATNEEMARLADALTEPELATIDGVDIRQQTAGEQLAGLRDDAPEKFVSPYLRGPHNRSVEQVLAERKAREAEIEDHLDQIDRDQTRDMIRSFALFDILCALVVSAGIIAAVHFYGEPEAPTGKIHTERLGQ